jgi:hypothetical protein
MPIRHVEAVTTRVSPATCRGVHNRTARTSARCTFMGRLYGSRHLSGPAASGNDYPVPLVAGGNDYPVPLVAGGNDYPVPLVAGSCALEIAWISTQASVMVCTRRDEGILVGCLRVMS